MLNSNISSTVHMSSQYGELQPTNGWDRLAGLEHPSTFQRVSWFRYCTTSLNAGQPNFAQYLAVSCAGRLHIGLHFRGSCSTNGILPDAKFTLRPSLAFWYIDSVTARHSSSGRQPNCGVQQRAPPIFGRAAFTLGIGPHSSVKRYCQDTNRKSHKHTHPTDCSTWTTKAVDNFIFIHHKR